MAAEMALSDSEAKFYVYVHRRATDGSVFYVGKGSGNRSRNSNRNPHWKRIVAKHGFTAEIVERDLTETQAFAREVALIAHFGRKNLCNLTDGGDGLIGLSEASRLASLRKRTGLKRTPEQCARISASLKGRAVSPEAAKNVSKALKGKRPSEKTYEGFRRWLTPERIQERTERLLKVRRRPVKCLETGVVYPSIAEALQWVRLRYPKARHGNVGRSCNSSTRKAYGYTWRYA